MKFVNEKEIRFGIRQSFDRLEQIEDRYVNLSVPVEMALPYYRQRRKAPCFSNGDIRHPLFFFLSFLSKTPIKKF